VPLDFSSAHMSRPFIPSALSSLPLSLSLLPRSTALLHISARSAPKTQAFALLHRRRPSPSRRGSMFLSADSFPTHPKVPLQRVGVHRPYLLPLPRGARGRHLRHLQGRPAIPAPLPPHGARGSRDGTEPPTSCSMPAVMAPLAVIPSCEGLLYQLP
jgi:hypothetical protein